MRTVEVVQQKQISDKVALLLHYLEKKDWKNYERLLVEVYGVDKLTTLRETKGTCTTDTGNDYGNPVISLDREYNPEWSDQESTRIVPIGYEVIE